MVELIVTQNVLSFSRHKGVKKQQVTIFKSVRPKDSFLLIFINALTVWLLCSVIYSNVSLPSCMKLLRVS